jgi:hypothetical protein
MMYSITEKPSANGVENITIPLTKKQGADTATVARDRSTDNLGVQLYRESPAGIANHGKQDDYRRQRQRYPKVLRYSPVML